MLLFFMVFGFVFNFSVNRIYAANAPDNKEKQEIFFFQDFETGFNCVVPEGLASFGRRLPELFSDKNGNKYIMFSNGAALGYTIGSIGFPEDHGCISFDVIMKEQDTEDKRETLLCLYEKIPLLSHSNIKRIQFCYYRGNFSVHIIHPDMHVKGLDIPVKWEKGRRLHISLYWETEGESNTFVFKAGDSRRCVSKGKAVMGKYNKLLLAKPPWQKEATCVSMGIDNIIISDTEYITNSIDDLLREQLQRGEASGNDVLARVLADAGQVSARHYDSDIRYAFDGNLVTSWWLPKKTKRNTERGFLIDLGYSVSLSSYKLCCTFSGHAPENRLVADKEGRLHRKVLPYMVYSSCDGENWQVAYAHKSCSNIYTGNCHKITFPTPVVAKYIKFVTKDRVGFGRISNVELYGVDGEMIPGFARMQKVNGILTEIRSLLENVSYIKKSAAWLKLHHNIIMKAELSEQEKRLDELANKCRGFVALTDKELLLLIEEYKALQFVIDQQLERSDRFIYQAIMPGLYRDAVTKYELMQKPVSLSGTIEEMKMLYLTGKEEDSIKFEQNACKINDAYKKYSLKHNLYIRRKGPYLYKPDQSVLIPYGVNYTSMYQLNSIVNSILDVQPICMRQHSIERDFRNMRLWGFNTIRLVIRPDWLRLYIKDGKLISYNMEYVDKLKQIIDWCYKYNIYVIIDIHTTNIFSDLPWTAKGNLPATSFLEKWLKKAFGLVAEEVKESPNVIGYELVANEANIRSGFSYAFEHEYKDEYCDMTLARPFWNNFLRKKYVNRDALNAAWSNTTVYPQENGLGKDENWDDYSILSPLQLNVKYPYLQHKYNTRLYDWMLCFSEYYRDVMSRLMEDIKKIDSNHLFVFERNHELQNTSVKERFHTTGRVMYDMEPSGISIHAGHYSEDMPNQLAPLGKPWYAGEMWIIPARAVNFSRFLYRGGGILGWQYFAHAKGYSCTVGFDMWIRDLWEPWAASSWFFNHPQDANYLQQAPIAIIISPLLPEAGKMQLSRFLNEMDVEYDLLSSLRVRGDLGILDKYKAVILPLKKMDYDVVKLILRDTKIPVFIYGDQNVDIYQRWHADTIPCFKDFFYKKQHTLVVDKKKSQESSPSINLQTGWYFKVDENQIGDKEEYFKKKSFDGWRRIPVPGAWELESIAGLQSYNGIAWYALKVKIPASMKGEELAFFAGAIDDFDKTYFNGNLIGATDSDTYCWWRAKRQYHIPADIINYDRDNTIVVRVQDDMNAGGITAGPVEIRKWVESKQEITFVKALPYVQAGETALVEGSSDSVSILTNAIADGVEVTALFADNRCALMRRDNFTLYLGGNGVSVDGYDKTERRILASFLKTAGVTIEYPVTSLSKSLNLREFQGYTLIENVGDEAVEFDAGLYCRDRDVEWSIVMKPPYKRINGLPTKVTIPAGSFMGIVY